MRQLDACDFCGDAADGVYEVVPAAVAGESRRLALCADCRTTLQSVLDPLLDAAGETTVGASDDSPEPDGAAASDPEPTPDVDSPEEPAAPADDADGVVIDAGEPEADVANENDASAEPERRPDGYAQVIRLLQNRDGAMPREDLRALATNAYDLGGREFEDAVDAAVGNGDVEETADGLRTA